MNDNFNSTEWKNNKAKVIREEINYLIELGKTKKGNAEEADKAIEYLHKMWLMLQAQ